MRTITVALRVFFFFHSNIVRNDAAINVFSLYVIRLEQGENLEENQRNLLQITERFFQAIIGSSSEFPPQLRSVCHCLYQVGSHPAHS